VAVTTGRTDAALGLGYAFEVLPQLLKALLVTLEITLLGSVVALLLGLLIAVLRQARIPVLEPAAVAFVEFVRSTRCWCRCSSCTSRCPASVSPSAR